MDQFSEILVMKFGGASMRTPAHIRRVADIIIERHALCKSIIVVVSAMGESTDELFNLAKKIHPEPPKREQDMLVSVGERISMALLAMALDYKGVQAISFTGSQSGIITSARHTEARILDVRPFRLATPIKEGKIVIVAGFQGVSVKGEITTLGRGGSDTSAVALAVSTGGRSVEFYKDVPGIFNVDPKKDPGATCYGVLSYDEALAIAQKADILHPRAIELAKKNLVMLTVRTFFKNQKKTKGTLIFDAGGALVSDEKKYEIEEDGQK